MATQEGSRGVAETQPLAGGKRDRIVTSRKGGEAYRAAGCLNMGMLRGMLRMRCEDSSNIFRGSELGVCMLQGNSGYASPNSKIPTLHKLDTFKKV